MEKQSAGTPGAVVAVVCGDQPLRDASGAFAALRCEIEALKQLDLQPVLIVTAPSLRRARLSDANRELLATRASALGVPLAAIVPTNWTLPAAPAFARLLRHALAGKPFGPEQDVDIGRLATPAESFDLGVRPAAVIANNLSSVAVADVLVPRTRQLLVLHYLPVAEPSARFRAALAGRPSLMTLSAVEAERLQQWLPAAAVHTGLHLSPRDIASASATPVQWPSIAAALVASGPARVPADGWQHTTWIDRRQADLLFVGGNHPANIEGLRNFVSTCFVPLLAPRGMTLLIAGAAGPALGALADHHNIAVTGYCRALEPLYAVARLVVVPQLSGDGAPTKTIEAIVRHKPVLATPIGLRGLGDMASLALAPPFDSRWQARIDELLGDDASARRLASDLAARLRGPILADTFRHVIGPLLAGRAVTPLPAQPLLASEAMPN